MTTTKKLIDLGTPGDETSGDTLNAGGSKINDNVESLWNTFSDDDGKLIGTLPFTRNYNYANALQPNRQYDVDTTSGSLIVRLAPASEGIYKTGDTITLRDYKGNWYNANVALVVQNDDGSISGNTQVAFRNSLIEVTLVCVDGVANEWVYSITSLVERTYKEVDITRSVTPTNPLQEVIYRTDVFHSMKFLITASSNVDPNHKSVSEILVTDDGTDAIFTDYANLNTTPDNEPVVNISFTRVNQEMLIDVTNTNDYPSCTVQVMEIEKIEKVN